MHKSDELSAISLNIVLKLGYYVLKVQITLVIKITVYKLKLFLESPTIVILKLFKKKILGVRKLKR